MSFSGVVKEKIARTIGEFFTTNEIVNVFDDANIPTDRELFAKWRITLDAFSKMSDQEVAIPHILSVFCHPLHFPDPQIRSNFIEKLNTILAYENLKIQATNKGAEMLTDDGFPIDASQAEKPASKENKPKQKLKSYEDKDKDEESYYFKNGFPYSGCALELFIARKILDRKTRPIFAAKEFSYKQHTYSDICYVINKFIEKGAVLIYLNTNPEDLCFGEDEYEETGQGGIKWSVVKRMEKNPKELKMAGFDFDIEDEVKLKGFIDIGIHEFMNDKEYGQFDDLQDISANKLTYEQQKDIVLKNIASDHAGDATIDISNYHNSKIDIVRTLLALEKEGILRIKEFPWVWQKNIIPNSKTEPYDDIKDFQDKDEVSARIRLVKKPENVLSIRIIEPIKIADNPLLPVAKKTKTSISELCLNSVGDLWREPKDKYCYSMMEAKERLALVKFLAEHHSEKYIQTQIIASALNKDAQYVRSEIGKINTAAQRNLKLKLIDSKQGSGYRINSKVKIKILAR